MDCTSPVPGRGIPRFKKLPHPEENVIILRHVRPPHHIMTSHHAVKRHYAMIDHCVIALHHVVTYASSHVILS